ncbi:hypothetical protein [Rathayibacter sp. AY1H2]|uniref:hypothetical protein n=1 Tax=Rathayibacter sp. AY1H2 TaxID=2080566 RepID=UPI000CE7F5B2|nr:hypothetical protein [Rathayibacter sp. AY1H2]PPG84591.1 hypothetical protein C5C29_08825 [Rathayibacter sp. AY1H2]
MPLDRRHRRHSTDTAPAPLTASRVSSGSGSHRSPEQKSARSRSSPLVVTTSPPSSATSVCIPSSSDRSGPDQEIPVRSSTDSGDS